MDGDGSGRCAAAVGMAEWERERDGARARRTAGAWGGWLGSDFRLPRGRRCAGASGSGWTWDPEQTNQQMRVGSRADLLAPRWAGSDSRGPHRPGRVGLTDLSLQVLLVWNGTSTLHFLAARRTAGGWSYIKFP